MKKQSLTLMKITAFALAMLFTLMLIPRATPSNATATETSIFPYDLGEPHWTSDDGVLCSWNDNGMAAIADVFVIEFQNEPTGGYNFILDSLSGEHLIFDQRDNRVTKADGRIILDIRELAIGSNIMFSFLTPSDWENVTRVYLDILPPDEGIQENPHPKVIYVDAENDNEGDGTKGNPFRSLTDAIQASDTSDVILVANGTYYGTITIPSGTENRPTILKAMPGTRPVITPTVPLDVSWSVYDGNIYVAKVGLASFQMNTEFPQLFVDGVSMIEARYPNLPGSDLSVVLEQEMLIAQAGTNANNIVLPEELPFDISGASVIIWPGDGAVTGWQADTSRISSVNGNIARLATPIDAPLDHVLHAWEDDKQPFPGNPFYLVGALSLLDAPGEYYYDVDTNNLYFYAPNGDDPNSLNLSLRSNERFAVMMSNNTVFDGFDIYGGGISARGRNITIQNSAIRYADHFNLRIGKFAEYDGLQGLHGFHLYGINNTVRNCIIGPTAGSGISTRGIGNVITNNIIHDVAYSGQWFAGITVYGHNENLEISNNSIINSGRDLIFIYTITHDDEPDCSLAGSIIRNNHLRNPMVFASDGGAIFMGGTDGGGTAEFYNNFVEVEEIRKHGVWDKAVLGIYFEGGDNYIVRNNISVGEGAAMSMSLPHEGMRVFNNTVIGARTGFKMFGHSYYGTEGIGFVLKDNLFVDIIVSDVTYTDYMGVTDVIYDNFDENGSFPFTWLERDGMTVSGNARGTVDEQFRPTGDTPNIGAVLRGEEMFEYGVSWEPGNVPLSDGLIPDYVDLNLGTFEPDNPEPPNTTPQTPDTPQDATPDTPETEPLSTWIIVAIAAGVVLVIVIVIVVVKKRK